ncbi:MAG: zinc ribbon domain-containing protein [Mycobacterium sp.]
MPERRFRHTRGGVYSLGASGKVPEVPAPGLGGRVVGRLDERLGQIATEYGGQIVAHEVMPDHVHLLVRVGRADAPACTELVRGHDVIGIEKLSLHRMTRRAKGAGAAQKRGLNRSLQHAALGRLGTCIAYKANLAQVSFIEVPAAFTSQRCHQCGHAGKGNRESQAVFRCRRCAWIGNADTNAAINIREEALARWAAHTEQLAGTSGEKPGGITPVSQAGSKSKTDPHTGPASGPAVSAMNRKPPNAA